MSEFTDGTMTGNTLSMVDMEKRLEALPTTDKVNALIKQAIADLLNSGDVATAGTKWEQIAVTDNMDGTKWRDTSYVAQKSGWYFLYCEINNSTKTPAAYIRSKGGENRVNGNGIRDLSCGPVWVKAGDTVYYGSINQQKMTLQMFTREA